MKKTALKMLMCSALVAAAFTSCKEESTGYKDLIAPPQISDIHVKNLDSKVIITWKDPVADDLAKIKFVYYDWVENDGSYLTEYVDIGQETITFENLVNDNGYDIKATVYDIHGNASPATNIAAVPTVYNGGFVLAYFKSGGAESADNLADAKTRNSLFLAYSEDGLHYTPCNNNNAVLKIDNSVGSGTGLIRDPFMTRCGDKFIMVATDWTPFGGSTHPEYGTVATTSYWNLDSQSLIFAESADMVNWSNQHCVRMVDSTYSNVRSVWAPQVIYDPDYIDEDNQLGKGAGNKGAFMVFWTGAGVEDPESGDYTRRTWANWTHDFVTFTKAKIIYEYEYQGSIVTEIDADIVPVNGKYYMDYKGESNDAKDIQMAVGETAHGPYSVMHNDRFISRTRNQEKSNGIEGSFIINSNDGKWWMFGDHYGTTSLTAATNFWGWSSAHGIDAAPALWAQHANDGQYSMPGGCRHGYATRITKAELETLKAATTFTGVVEKVLP